MPLIFLWIAFILVCALYSALPTLSPGMWVSEWLSDWVSAGVNKRDKYAALRSPRSGQMFCSS